MDTSISIHSFLYSPLPCVQSTQKKCSFKKSSSEIQVGVLKNYVLRLKTRGSVVFLVTLTTSIIRTLIASDVSAFLGTSVSLVYSVSPTTPSTACDLMGTKYI